MITFEDFKNFTNIKEISSEEFFSLSFGYLNGKKMKFYDPTYGYIESALVENNKILVFKIFDESYTSKKDKCYYFRSELTTEQDLNTNLTTFMKIQENEFNKT